MFIRCQGAREVIRLGKAAGSFLGLDLSTLTLCAGAAKAQGSRSEVLASESKAKEARRLFATFCEEVPATRVAPTWEELATLWSRCRTFPPSVVAEAIRLELEGACGAHAWQPQLRALRFLAHLYEQGVPGRAVASRALAEAGGLVRHLAEEVPECQEDASWVLLVSQLAAVLPPGQEFHVALHGGLLHFIDAGPPPTAAAAAEGAAGAAATGAAWRPPPLDLLGSPRVPPAAAASASAPAPAATGGPQAPVAAVDDLISLVDPPAEAHFSPQRPRPPPPPAPPKLPSKGPRTRAQLRPERFDIGGGDAAGDDTDLNRMFSFNAFSRKPAFARPTSAELDALPKEHVGRRPDPFDFVAAHLGLA